MRRAPRGSRTALRRSTSVALPKSVPAFSKNLPTWVRWSDGRSRSSRPTSDAAATSTPTSTQHRAPAELAPEQHPPEQREAGRGRDRAAEVVAPERHAHDDDGDREQRDGDAYPAPRRHPPREQAREQHRRRGELRERQVALADEADADGRRVAEHGVPLEVRAGDEVDEVQHDDAAEADEDRVDRPPSGDEHARSRDQRAPRRSTNAQYAAAPPWRPKCTGPARYVASRYPRSHSATNASNPASRRRRHRSTTAVSTVSPHGDADDHAHRRTDEAVAEQPVLVHVDEELACARRASRRRRRSPSGAPPWRRGARDRSR